MLSQTLRIGLFGAALVAAAPAVSPPEVEQVGEVSLVRIEGVRAFEDATLPGAIRFACAHGRQELEAFFASRTVKLEAALLRRRHGFAACHVFYEPTVPGFRAAPDDDPVTGVFGALDPATFVVGREPHGDSLEILQTVLARAPHPLDVTLTINQDYDPRHWPAAAQRRFGAMPHRIQTRPSRAEVTQPWAQDYLKSGWAAGDRRLLVPYRLYEGRAGDGEIFRPLLDGFEEGRLIRSKLSWEGGDLQLARDPRDPDRLILFHGAAARAYWGANLDPAEYAYVLRSELGADASVGLSGLSAHVDYVLTLLPLDRTVLLSAPVRGDAVLMRAAADALSQAWAAQAPASLAALATSIQRGAPPERIRQRIEQVQAELASLDLDLDPVLSAELDAYSAQHCPQDPDACFDGAPRAEMFERAPALLKRALDAVASMVVKSELTPRLLGVIEAQLRAEPWPREALLERKARELERLGFRVLRIPHLVAENAGAWPGVSYANSLVWGRRIFVPALGLGGYEDRLYRDLEEQLGRAYEVIPVPARFALLRNGGVHCVFGLVRGSAPPPFSD